MARSPAGFPRHCHLGFKNVPNAWPTTLQWQRLIRIVPKSGKPKRRRLTKWNITSLPISTTKDGWSNAVWYGIFSNSNIIFIRFCAKHSTRLWAHKRRDSFGRCREAVQEVDVHFGEYLVQRHRAGQEASLKTAMNIFDSFSG